MSHEPRIHFLGHATVMIELEDHRILTDPALRPIIGPLVRSGPVPTPADYADVDLVLISHLHHDHLDLPSLRLLPGDPTVLVPVGGGPFLRRNGVGDVVEVAEGDRIDRGSLRIRAVHAVHPGQRPPLGPTGPALGYLLEGARHRIYFAGDTDIYGGMAELGDPDIALIPVSGWGPTRGKGHLDPREAAEALRLIRPRVAIPIHWGTFWPRGLGMVRADRRTGAAALFAKHAAELAPEVDVRIALPGERVSLPRHHDHPVEATG